MKSLMFVVLALGIGGCTKEATLYRCKACVVGEPNNCIEHVDSPTTRCSSEDDARFSAMSDLCSALKLKGSDRCGEWFHETTAIPYGDTARGHIATTCSFWKARVTNVPIFFSGR